MRSTDSPSRTPDPGPGVVGALGPSFDPGLPVLPRPGEAAGFTLARLAVLVALGIGADRLLTLSQDRAWAVLGVTTVVAMAPVARFLSALAGAGVTWLLGTGFESNRLGELTFGITDREHLVVALAAAAVALLVSRRAAAVRRTDAAATRRAG